MWYRGLLLSAPLSLRLRLAAIVRGGRKIEHPFIVFFFCNSTVSQLDPAKLPLRKKLLKQMIVKLYSKVRLSLDKYSFLWFSPFAVGCFSQLYYTTKSTKADYFFLLWCYFFRGSHFYFVETINRKMFKSY